MHLLKPISCLLIVIASRVHADDYITNKAAEIFVGGACIASSTIREGQQALGEVKVLREQNQTLKSSLESTTAKLTASQAIEATQASVISNLTNDIAATHIAKQQAEAAAALAVHTERANRDEVVRQLSKTEAVAVGLGIALTIGVVVAIGYWVYCGVSSYNHSKSKEATHQQLKACIEGDDASLAKSRNCEKEFHEFARYAQGEELLLEQQRITGRTRTS